MRIQRVLLAAAAALTLAAPAAAFADPHGGSSDHRGDIHRGYDDRGGRLASQDRVHERGGRDGWRFHRHRHHHHDHRDGRQWR